MATIKERILACETADELNSLRLLAVQDKANARENQEAFIKMVNRLRRKPASQRGKLYNPEIEQQVR